MPHRRPSLCFEAACGYPLFHSEVAGTIGGAERQLYLLARALSESHETHFLVADHGQAESEVCDGIRVWRTFRLQDGRVRKLIRLIGAILRVRADVYIFRAPNIAACTALVLVRYILRKRFVYMVAHDMEMDPSDLARTLGRATALAMGFVYRHASLVTTQSLFQGQYFEKCNRNVALVRNVYPVSTTHETEPQARRSSFSGVPLSPVEPLKSEEICVRGEYQSETYIGYGERGTEPQARRSSFSAAHGILWVGRPLEWKQPEIFVELARNHGDIAFTMILPHQPDQAEYRKNIVRLAENVQNLMILGNVAPKDMPEHYGRASIYVLSSRYEGFSNTMMEAMDAECAILSLSVNPDGIFDSGEIGICAGGDIDAFSEAFERLVRDAHLRESLGRGAREYLVSHHSAEHITRDLSTLLTHL